MIYDIDILQAVQEKLKEKWGEIPVYLQEVKEGFPTPAFFLKTLTVATPQGHETVYRDTDIYITYIPKKMYKTSGILQVMADVEDCLRDGLKVKDRLISVSTMTEELLGGDNDGGRVTVTLQYYESSDQDEISELMRILHQTFHGKENQ